MSERTVVSRMSRSISKNWTSPGEKIKDWFILVLVSVVLCGAIGIPLVLVTVNPIVPKHFSLEVAVEQTISNVVHIINNSGKGQGSGVLVAPDLVLTARHVAEGGENFDIMTSDGKVYKSTRAISSKKYDLGFIKLDVQLPYTIKLGSIKDCRLGETVYAIGSPYGDVNFNSVTLGIISSLYRELERFDCPSEYGWSVTFQTDAAGHPGNSGCPVFTLDGVLRGILVGGLSNSIIYCIPVDLCMSDIEIVQRMFDEDRYEIEQKKVFNPQESYEELYNKIQDNKRLIKHIRDMLEDFMRNYFEIH